MKNPLPIIIICLLQLMASVAAAQTPTWQWAKASGGNYQEQSYPKKIQADSSGNVYAMGFFQSATIKFGSYTLTNPGAPNRSACYFVKYNPQGIAQWAKNISPANPTAFITDRNGNSTILADFTGSITILGVTYTDSYFSVSSNGKCLIRIDSGGVVTSITAKHMKRSWLTDMYAYDATHMLMAGTTRDPNHPYTLPAINDTIDGIVCPSGTFIALMDTAGTFTQYKFIGYDTLMTGSYPNTLHGPIVTAPRSFAISPDKSIFMHLHQNQFDFFNSTIPIPAYSLDPMSYGSSAGYIVKLDSNLNFHWATPLTSVNTHLATTTDNIGFMTTDKDNDVYTLGVFQDTLLLDDSAYSEPHNFSSTPVFIYLFKLSGVTGHVDWIKLTRDDESKVWDICPDKLGNIYAMGNNFFDITFDNITVSHHSSANSLFIYKFKPDGTTVWGKGNDMAGSVWQPAMTEDGRGNIYIHGDFVRAVSFDADTLSWTTPANGYPNASDVFVARLNHCQPVPPAITASAALKWCGTDSVELTSPVFQHYLWNTGDTTPSIMVYTTGNYHVTGIDSSECYAPSPDKHIDAYPLPALPIITQSGNKLQSTLATSYQWYYNGAAITAATSQTYTPVQNGDYTVELTDSNNCTATSIAYTYVTTGVGSVNTENNISIMPNPFSEHTAIVFTEEQKNTTITITDGTGRAIRTIRFSGKQLRIDKGEMQAGVYFLQIAGERKNAVHKIIVQ
jgi:hypothetical protein